MTTQPKTGLSFRSYGAEHPVHAHEYVQIVLPLQGELEIEIDGRGARLNGTHGAVVPPGAKHTQFASGKNIALVVDCSSDCVESHALSSKLYRSIPAQTQRLLAFLEMNKEEGEVSAFTARHAMPLLLDSLARASGATATTQKVRALVSSKPCGNWTVQSMALASGMSASALHAAFRTEIGDTPARFASRERLRAAVALLQEGRLSIAEIALQCGYSDQTALTRAMRRELGVTPGRLRRRVL